MGEELYAGGRYKKIKDLNSGSFGSVVLAKDTRDDSDVAIKFMKRSQVTHYVERELMTHRLLWHPHIVKLHEVFLTPTHLAIVLEYADRGDMYEYVSGRGRLKDSQARWIFQQLMVAVDYLHKRGVASRDIKLENTLLAGNADKPLVKICDLGFAKHLQMHSAPDSQVGTPSYFAPEIVSAKKYDGLVADIWSCGVMLYVMLYGAYPFERSDDSKLKPADAQKKLLKRIQGVDYVLHPHVPVGDDAKDMIRRMLVRDPAKRISMPEIFQHPFFAKGLPPGVVEMNDKLLGNQNIPPRQSESEIKAILASAVKKDKAMTEYMDAVDEMLDMY